MALPDTQWPRYQVFVQEREGEPHLDYGSVHAPDQEMALLNARDVFVRRPECVNIWVAPADAIFARTAEELERGQPEVQGQETEEKKVLYHVFQKQRSAGTHQLVGQVEAGSPPEALAAALEKFKGSDPFSWWVIPASVILQSELEDIESMFAPAREKLFRMATDFHTHTAMRQIKQRIEEN